MPRRKRVDKRKAVRNLDSQVWDSLKDNPTFTCCSASNNATFLKCLAIEQRVPRGEEAAFWRRIRAAVLAGDIEVADDVQHTREDAPLLLCV